MKKGILLLSLLVVLAVANTTVYLGSTPEQGFPVDDAWIHQVYARNLGTKGTMSFADNAPSTGSTAPAWSLLLALGYVLNAAPTHWAYFLGTLFAVLSAALAALLSYEYFGRRYAAAFVAALCLLEWHLAWASLSGMEITLFIFLSLLFFLLLKRNAHPAWIGLLTGVAFLVRPEGLLLGGVYGLSRLVQSRANWKRLVCSVGLFSQVFAAVVGPVIVFNYVYGGKPFPNTVSAKYLQYGFPWSPLKSLGFLVDVAKYFFLGPYLLLTPFFLYMVYRTWSEKNQALVYPLVWMASFIALYSVALPAIYHHGRYLMPLIPWIAILGMEGLSVTMDRFRNLRFFWPVYLAALVAMVVGLWIDHAATYSLQVELLRENHMRNAEWIRDNTDPTAVVATHDIGLLGYVAGREIVDLAGLITPEVIPLLSDQHALADFSLQKGTDYFVVFSGYYQELLDATDAQWVFTPDSPRLQEYGVAPFEIYQVEGD